jgi:hypothetical protein
MVQASNDAFISLAGAEDTNLRQNYYEINIGSSNGRHIDISRTSVKKNVYHSRTGKLVISRPLPTLIFPVSQLIQNDLASSREITSLPVLEWYTFFFTLVRLMSIWRPLLEPMFIS